MEIRKKRNISGMIAIILISMIAIGGTVAAYLQYEQKKEYVRASEEAFAAQENYVMSVFERIETNLAKIREKESLIQQNFSAPENYENLGIEERIQNEIDFIALLIDENNHLLESLNKQLSEKDSRLKNYEANIRDLKSRVTQYQEDVNILLAEKEALLHNLNETIAAKNQLFNQVDILGKEIVDKSAIIEDQRKTLLEKELALHTGYYAVGSYKVLRDKEILQKEGGFLGINRVTTLTGNPEKDLFHEVDTREVLKIPVEAERWEIVTGQDPSTYVKEFENGKTEWIRITDPQKFWGKSKYLVIVIRDNNYDELASSR